MPSVGLPWTATGSSSDWVFIPQQSRRLSAERLGAGYETLHRASGVKQFTGEGLARRRMPWGDGPTLARSRRAAARSLGRFRRREPIEHLVEGLAQALAAVFASHVRLHLRAPEAEPDVAAALGVLQDQGDRHHGGDPVGSIPAVLPDLVGQPEVGGLGSDLPV